MATTPFQFPQFNMQGFPYSSLPDQLAASFLPGNQQFDAGSQFGRWNGVNNNAFGLFPAQWGSVFGSPTASPMAFQPPYGNNGTLGSNQGPGSNPLGGNPGNVAGQPQPFGGTSAPNLVTSPTSMPGYQSQAPMPTGDMFANKMMMQQPGMIQPGTYTGLSGSGSGMGSYSGPNTPMNTQIQSLAGTTTGGLIGGGGTGYTPSGGLLGSGTGAVGPSAMMDKMAFANGPTQQSFGGNQQFSPAAIQAQLAQGNSAGAQAMAAANRKFSTPSFTSQDFNRVAAVNPGVALTMLTLGGQPYINAVTAQNGWSPLQMHQWENNTFNDAQGAMGFNKQNQALLNSLGIG